MNALLSIFKRPMVIIPIGCDCHPAHLLAKLGLRDKSLPFDWLNTDPLLGINYVYENIVHHFKYFAKDLKINQENQVYAAHYDYSFFYHHGDIIKDAKVRLKFSKRCKRFLRYTKRRKCVYLYNVTSHRVDSSNSVTLFMDSIKRFRRIMKGNDLLLIYIRYDESMNENAEYCGQLFQSVQDIENVRIAHYIRYKAQFGIWGNESQYISLLKDLGMADHCTNAVS